MLGGLGTGSWWLLLRDSGGTASAAADGGTGSSTLVSGDDPRAVAQQFVTLLQRAEDEGELAVTPDAMRQLVCDADMTEIEQAYAELRAAEPVAPSQQYTYSVKDVTTEADTGQVSFERRDDDSGESETQDASLIRESGQWQVCGLSNASAPEDPTPEATQ